jgi:hypothetical protein
LLALLLFLHAAVGWCWRCCWICSCRTLPWLHGLQAGLQLLCRLLQPLHDILLVIKPAKALDCTACSAGCCCRCCCLLLACQR